MTGREFSGRKSGNKRRNTVERKNDRVRRAEEYYESDWFATEDRSPFTL
jgi:hypothetical protein